MAEKTSDRVDGETPNGGTYSIMNYQDAEGNPTTKAKAVAAYVVEYNAKDEPIFRTYLNRVN